MASATLRSRLRLAAAVAAVLAAVLYALGWPLTAASAAVVAVGCIAESFRR